MGLFDFLSWFMKALFVAISTLFPCKNRIDISFFFFTFCRLVVDLIFLMRSIDYLSCRTFHVAETSIFGEKEKKL